MSLVNVDRAVVMDNGLLTGEGWGVKVAVIVMENGAQVVAFGRLY